MSRRTERSIIYLTSIWQIITGTITVGLYFTKLDMALGAEPGVAMFGKFIFTYGMGYITLGLLNVILTNKYVKDHTVQKKIPTYWLGLAFVFGLLTDYVSLMLFVLSAVIGFAKNKPIILKEKTKLFE